MKLAPHGVAFLFVIVGIAVLFPGTSGASDRAGGAWKTIVLASARSITVPPPRREEIAHGPTVAEPDERSVLRWNRRARELVASHSVTPPQATRIYAALSVAQYDTLVVTWYYKFRYNRPPPGRGAGGTVLLPSYPSEHAAIARTSAQILSEFFPDVSETLMLEAAAETEERVTGGLNFRGDVIAGERVGREVARRVLNRIADDGASAQFTGAIPVGEQYWRSSMNPARPPLLPMWGKVRTWILRSVEALRPPPPPAIDSPEFAEALREVRAFSDHRTEEQLRIAQYWADGAGTSTPPGHWNEIASGLIRGKGMSELRAAQTLAFLNMAMMDAGICCWDAKYAYWLLRPSQADPAITTPVGLPNFPAYTSGHSTFSSTAAHLLGFLFPNRRPELIEMAREASLSRIYGGIHYRFDAEVGFRGGRKLAAVTIRKLQKSGYTADFSPVRVSSTNRI